MDSLTLYMLCWQVLMAALLIFYDLAELLVDRLLP